MCAVRVDPGQKAIECEHAILLATDPNHRELLACLRLLWTTIGIESGFVTRSELEDQIEQMIQIQDDMNATFNVRIGMKLH